MQMLYKEVEAILDDFDFYKVQKAMIALNWTWASTGAEVPDVGDLRRVARQLLNQVYSALDVQDEFYVSTGGFKASGRMFTRSNKKYLQLEFIISSWDNHND